MNAARQRQTPAGLRRLARSGTLPARHVAVVLSAYAAILHDVVLPAHYHEWWGYGAYFFAATAAQAFYSGALLFWPNRSVLVAGIVGNAAMLVLYAVTRGFGIPFFGPHAGLVEPVGPIDLLTAAAEITLIAVLIRLVRARSICTCPTGA